MLTWETNGKLTVARLGLLGQLVVRRKVSDWEVVVFHQPLSHRSPSLEDGKLRAMVAARTWLRAAMAKLEAPNPCPKRAAIGGCDFPACDCSDK